MALPLKIGTLRNWLEVQSFTESRNSFGDVVRSWSTDETRWASVTPISGQEIFAQEQADARITHRIIVRYVSGLNETQRLKEGSRIFNIIVVRNVQDRDVFQEVLAIEDTTNNAG